MFWTNHVPSCADCHLQDKCFLSFGSSESSDAYKKVCNSCQHAVGGHLLLDVLWLQQYLCSLDTFVLQVQRKLVIACILCFIFMIIEVIGGYIAKRYVHVALAGIPLCVLCCEHGLATSMTTQQASSKGLSVGRGLRDSDG
jgi:hypothetical protein